MKALYIVLLVFLIASGSHCLAQCCCSKAQFSIKNKEGKVLTKSEVQVKELTKEKLTNKVYLNRVYFDPNWSSANAVTFHIGCGLGNEVVLIKYKGNEMRIHFRIYGEFGRPQGGLVFDSGDYIAWLGENKSYREEKPLLFRKAGVEDLKN